MRAKALPLLIVVGLAFFGVAHASVIDSVTAKVDSYAVNISARLKLFKVDLEKEIHQLQTQETATTQTPTGQQINDAVGDDSFVPATKPTGTPTQTLLRIAKQLLLLLVNTTIYILEHKPLLYIAVVGLVFFVLRFLWRMVGRQQF